MMVNFCYVPAKGYLLHNFLNGLKSLKNCFVRLGGTSQDPPEYNEIRKTAPIAVIFSKTLQFFKAQNAENP
jgi:hypothetical protein